MRTGGGAWLKACRRWTSRYYQSISWHSIFAGMGVCPDAGSLRAPTPQESRVDMAELEDCLARCALNFDRHQEFLARQ